MSFPTKPAAQTIVVVDPEKDGATVKRCTKLGIACVSAEFILSGVIQQALNAKYPFALSAVVLFVCYLWWTLCLDQPAHYAQPMLSGLGDSC